MAVFLVLPDIFGLRIDDKKVRNKLDIGLSSANPKILGFVSLGPRLQGLREERFASPANLTPRNGHERWNGCVLLLFLPK